jgi:ABC-2 type transport system ATP-binding protein
MNNSSIIENQIAIRLDKITKEFPGVLALDEVNMSVNRGTVHGLLGPNGAGKSTAMKIITGLLAFDKGQVFINGEELGEKSRRLVGILPEHPPLYLNMRVRDYLKFVYEIHRLQTTGKNNIDWIIERCALKDVQNRLIGNLSKGYKQRVGLAQALVFNPEIIILDEPTVGLDPHAINEMRELILELKKDHTILLSTHLLHEVTRVCDDITIINRGKIMTTGPLSEIQKQFQGQSVIIAKVKFWDQELEGHLRESHLIKKVEVFSEVEKFLLRIETETEIEKIGHYLANHCGLLSLGEEEKNLENIFEEVIQK